MDGREGIGAGVRDKIAQMPYHQQDKTYIRDPDTVAPYPRDIA